ncbi:hypothetical protein Hanom_Chr12g01120031 [Helianthus anomalus]
MKIKLKSLNFIVNKSNYYITLWVANSTRPATEKKKKVEMKFIKAQLADLERRYKQQVVPTFVDDPWRLSPAPFVRTTFDPQPLPKTFPSLSLVKKRTS